MEITGCFKRDDNVKNTPNEVLVWLQQVLGTTVGLVLRSTSATNVFIKVKRQICFRKQKAGVFLVDFFATCWSIVGCMLIVKPRKTEPERDGNRQTERQKIRQTERQTEWEKLLEFQHIWMATCHVAHLIVWKKKFSWKKMLNSRSAQKPENEPEVFV